MTVAARYGASNYLIGPALYPAYLASLKVLAWVWGPIAALSVFLSVVTADDPLRQAAWKLLLVTVIGLANFAIITLIFARIERAAASPARVQTIGTRARYHLRTDSSRHRGRS